MQLNPLCHLILGFVKIDCSFKNLISKKRPSFLLRVAFIAANRVFKRFWIAEEKAEHAELGRAGSCRSQTHSYKGFLQVSSPHSGQAKVRRIKPFDETTICY